ncbi:NAC domain-containing protein 41 [Jatropha curcas]|uniref:NAC domain-containing protein 41 n=1 Tax=Jatropha curcas TaxID=180498 RepID=UPI00189303A7|nr:NAC domain-containing protein 41 [Jatropha curcas]
MAGNPFMLPVGYRFCPTEEELVCFYLQEKLHKTLPVIVDAFIKTLDDLYSDEPWNIFCNETPVNGYFYVFTKLKSRSAKRSMRTTPSGTWTARSSKDIPCRNITYVKKDFVFKAKGKEASSSNGHWTMLEFSLKDERFKGDYVICKIKRAENSEQGTAATVPFLDGKKDGKKRKSSVEKEEENDNSKKMRQDNLSPVNSNSSWHLSNEGLVDYNSSEK